MGFRKVIQMISLLCPWTIRRWLLATFLGYSIHPSSRIGRAWVFTKKLIMEAGSSIGHLTVCKGLDLLWLKEKSTIGRANWITGYPTGNSMHFSHQLNRIPQLILGEHAAITNRHLIDCTNSVSIGRFSTLAGFRSQILTHSIDLERCIQSSTPITIGDYCFVGTDCVLLGGSSLPNYAVLGAKSLLNKAHSKDYHLYAGVPAMPVKPLSHKLKYFSRTTGFVS